jgi:ubiquitin-small subunit ribosomal protein S27Ae
MAKGKKAKIKGKKPRKVRKQKKLHTLYEIKGDKLERKTKFCPKCDKVFMGKHKNRLSCGKCHYTVFESKA